MSSKKCGSFLKHSLKDYTVGEESNLCSVALGTSLRQGGRNFYGSIFGLFEIELYSKQS